MTDISDMIAVAMPEIITSERYTSFMAGVAELFPTATSDEMWRGLIKAARAAVRPHGVEIPPTFEVQTRVEDVACIMLIPHALALGGLSIPLMEMAHFVAFAVQGVLLEEFLQGSTLAAQVLEVLQGHPSEDPRAHRLAGRST